MATHTSLRLTKVTSDFDDFKSSLVNYPVGSKLDYVNAKDYSNAHFYLTIPPGSAVVTLKGSFDEVNFVAVTSHDESGTEYATLTSSGSYWANVAGFKVVRWETTTGGTSAGSLVGRISKVGQGWSAGNPITTVADSGGGGGTTGTVDGNNSTTSPVLANITFVGTATEVKEYSTIVINVYADQNGTLFVEHSSDGTNWDISNSYPYTAAEEYSLRTPVIARYYRLRFTNGVTDQTAFRMQALLGSQAVDPPAASIDTTGLAVSGIEIASNSSTTPLAGEATFTGSAVEVTAYSIVVVNVNTDKISTLTIDFSSDGTNWDISTQHHIDPGSGESVSVDVQSKFMRVRLTNDEAGAQSFLRLQTLASVGNTKDGLASSLNSTFTALGAGETFTGTWENVTSYATITIFGATDQNMTLYADSSHDGISVLRTVQLSSGDDTTIGPHGLIVLSKYFRIRVTCGATPMSSLTVQTLYFKDSRIAIPTSRINTPLSDYSNVLNTRGVTFGKRPDLTYGLSRQDGVAMSTTTNLEGAVLDGALSDSATTVTVDDASAFPSSGTIVIDGEEITYTGTTATTFTGCTRGANLTTAAAHDDGDAVGELFESSVLDCSDYTQVQTEILSSHTGIVHIRWCSDSGGTNIVRAINVQYNDVNDLKIYAAPIFAPYIVYKYYHYGGVTQTNFYYHTNFITKAISPQILSLEAFIAPSMAAGVTRSILTGKKPNDEYKNVNLDAQGHLEVAIHDPILPFGSLHTENITSIFQYDGVYSLSDNAWNDASNGSGLGGSASVSDSLIVCNTTTNLYGNATVQSVKRLRYKAGQGSIMRFTCQYTSGGATDTYQVAGMGHPEDGYYFGYKNTVFGILHVNRNLREIAKLTVTAVATSGGDVTITLGGVAYTVTLSGTGTINRTVWEIATHDYDGWEGSINGTDIYFLAGSSGVKTNTYTFVDTDTTGATVTAFARFRAGDKTTYPETFIPQSTWNSDVMDGTGSSSNPSGVLLDPSKFNIFEIGMQYLGVGAVSFKIVTVAPGNNNPAWTTVHTIKNPNTLERTHVGNPSMPFTMSAYKTGGGSATDLTIKTASIMGGIEGKNIQHGPRISYRNFNSAIGTTVESLFIVKNGHLFNNIPNQAVIYIKSLTAAARGGNNVLTSIYLIKNPTITGSPVFNEYDSGRSAALYCETSGLTISYTNASQLVYSTTIGETGGTRDSFDSVSEQIALQPGEIMALCASTSQSTAYVVASLNTREDQ